MLYQEGRQGSQARGDIALYLKGMGEKLEALMGEIMDDWEQRKQWAARRETGRRQKADMECHSCHQKGHFTRECLTNVTEGCSGNGRDGDGRERAISPRADQGEQSQISGRHRFGGVDPGRSDLVVQKVN